MKFTIDPIRLLVAIFCCASAALGASGMSNEDVLKMADAGLSEEIIISAVQGANTAEFDVSPEGLIALKGKKVSDAVVQAMQDRAQGRRGGADDSSESRGGSIDYNDVPDHEVLPTHSEPVAGNTYYTRFSCMHEKGKHAAANYARGSLLPINTEVVLVSEKRKEFTIRVVETSETIEFQNEPKYTNLTVPDLAARFLSGEPTKIEAYGDDMARAIRTGTVRLGMTKTQVLLARGYPPVHDTPSTDADAWKYWSSRFVVQTLVFDRGVLVQGRGIR